MVGTSTSGNRNASPETRFGAVRANPQSHDAGGAKPWSYKNASKFLSGKPATYDEATGKIKSFLPEHPSQAQFIIAKVIEKAANEADVGAVKYLTEQVDGRVASLNINAEFSMIMGMNDDELRAIAEGDDTPLAIAEASDSEAGTETPAGSAGDAQGENGRPDKTTSSAGV